MLDPSKAEVDLCIPQITPNTSFYRAVRGGLAMNLAIRTESEPAAIIPEVQRVFRSISPELEHSSFITMDQVLTIPTEIASWPRVRLELCAG